MPVRGSAPNAQRHSLLPTLMVVLLALRSPPAVAVDLIRIPLESDDHLQFVGTVRLGSSRQRFRVVFDTGSSDTWVSHVTPADLEAKSRCLKDNSDPSFHPRYGSGSVSGFAVAVDLRLEGDDNVELLLPDVCVGIVDNKTPDFERLETQGIIGLGMDALAQINSNHSFLTQLSRHQAQTEPVIFSVYISSSLRAQPPSQLILGGADTALTRATAAWINFPVVSSNALHPPESSRLPSLGMNGFGYWALRLQGLALDGRLVLLNDASRREGVALIDSGTSFVLLPPHVFDAVSQELFNRFDKRVLPRRAGLLTCRSCEVHEFPSLAFDFWIDDTVTSGTMIQRLELQGSDYVRCDRHRRECTAMLDTIQPSEVDAEVPIVVLGTVFLCAYYARFDYTHRQVALACTLDGNGVCTGGLNPVLDYDGYQQDPHTAIRTLAGLWVVATALALLAGLRILVGLYSKPLRLGFLGKKQHK